MLQAEFSVRVGSMSLELIDDEKDDEKAAAAGVVHLSRSFAFNSRLGMRYIPCGIHAVFYAVRHLFGGMRGAFETVCRVKGAGGITVGGAW